MHNTIVYYHKSLLTMDKEIRMLTFLPLSWLAHREFGAPLENIEQEKDEEDEVCKTVI